MMKTYGEYKQSQYEWIRSIPNHWHELFLEQICREKCEKNTNNIENNVLSLSYGSIVRKKNKDAGLAPKDFATYQIISSGDIILRLTDLQNDHRSLRTGLVNERGIITSAYTCLEPFGNSAYLHYLLHFYDIRKYFYGLGGGVRQSIGFKDIRHIFIPVPPRTEQDQIVRYLDWQVSKINKLIAAKKKKIEFLKEQEQSIIYHFITGGHCKTAKKISGIDWVKQIPAHWDILYLSQVSEEQDIKNTGMAENNLLSLSYGKIIRKDINSTDGLLPTSFEGYQIIDDGNIILRLTDLQNDHKSLRTGLVTERGIITSAYTCLKVRNNVNSNFLRLQLHAADLCKVFYGMGGGIRQSIGFKELRKMLVFVPPLSEQQEILDLIDEKCNKISPTCDKIKSEISILEELRNKLISDVVTGQIDVRDVEIPDFEYVEETEEFDDDDEPADEEE